jgi:hypothetical protein
VVRREGYFSVRNCRISAAIVANREGGAASLKPSTWRRLPSCA